MHDRGDHEYWSYKSECFDFRVNIRFKQRGYPNTTLALYLILSTWLILSPMAGDGLQRHNLGGGMALLQEPFTTYSVRNPYTFCRSRITV